MKFTWNALKIVFAFVLMIAVIFWAVNSVRSVSYSGTDLSFDVGGGSNTVTNSSDDPVAVQLVSSGTRTFRVASTIEGVSGSSARVGTGSTRSQQFDFELPSGTHEFTVSGGTDVRFLADTERELQATVNPMTSESRRTTLIAAAVVVLGVLFYASHVTGHQWFTSLRHKVLPPREDTSKQDTKPTPVVVDKQGRAGHSYGDNRKSTGD